MMRRSLPGTLARQFEEIFEDAPDIVLANDGDGWVLAANRAAREFVGYTAEDLRRGVHLRQILAPQDFEVAMGLVRRALDGERIFPVGEREVELRDGSRRFIEVRSSVLRRRGRPFALLTIGRDITEKREAAEFQESLVEVSRALLTAPRLEVVGRVLCTAAGRILRVDGAYLWVREGDDLALIAAAGWGAEHVVGQRRAIADSTIGDIYRASDVLVVHDLAHSLYADSDWAVLGVQAMLAVPLRREGPPLGVLVFADRNPRGFTRVLRDRAVIFATQLTVAVEAALAREREEEEGKVSAALLRVGNAMRSSLREDELVVQIARSARDEGACDWAVVGMWNPRANRFEVVAAEGWRGETLAELGLLGLRPNPEGPSPGVLEKVLRCETVELPSAPRGFEAFFARWQVASCLVVPMHRGGRVVGLLALGYRQRTGPFSPRERRIAEGVAAQAAVAVENARLVEDLRRANRLKTEFVSTMSHELRTPLSAILGYAELMRAGAMGALTEDQAQALDRVLLNGAALLELIDTTLDVSRLEAGRATVAASHFALDSVVAELREELGARCPPQVALEWPPEGALPALTTDRPKLKAILRNLVDNALKFTSVGKVSVEAEYDSERDWVRFVVRDTGIGIPAHALESIFEMFQQVGRSLPSSRQGVGLGLYVVRRFTELLGGKVSVESAPGRGSVFIVELPRQAPAR